MSLDLSGRTVLVTGAGRPLGASLTERLTRLGAHVVTCDAYDAPGIRAASGPAGGHPGHPGRVDALVNLVTGEPGPLDARTATAGALTLLTPHANGAIVHVVTAPPAQETVAGLVRDTAAGAPDGVRVNAVVVQEEAERSAAGALAQLVGFLVSEDASSVDGRTLVLGGAPAPAPPADDAVVVVGMGLALPGASSPEQFWELLKNGEPVFGEPGDRLDLDTLWSADATAEDKTYSRVSGFMTGFEPHPRLRDELASGAFDSEEYTALWLRHSLLGATEKVTVRPDDRQLFAVGLTPDGSHHLEHSLVTAGVRGILAEAGEELPDTFRTHYPLASDSPEDVLPYRIARMAAPDLPASAEIVVVDTACSSSLYTVDLGVRALLAGEADVALCGGAFALSAQNLVLFSKLRGLSRSGRVRSLDRDADGVLFSDGAAVLALKTYARAIADGDPVLGFVAGFGGSSDGRGKAIYAPNAAGQTIALDRAWRSAGVTPEDVDWIVAHATGTPTGDRTEMTALTRSAGPDKTWTMTSNKSLVGHAGWAAGAVSAIHALLAMRHEVIPAQRQFGELPEGVTTAVRVPVDDVPWAATAGRRRTVGVSAMGFGGTNGHLVLTDRPPARAETTAARPAATEEDPVVVVAEATHFPGDPDEERVARWLSGDTADWPSSFGDAYPLPSPVEVRLAPSAIAAMDRSQLMAVRCADRLAGAWAKDAELSARTGVLVGHSGPTRAALGSDLRCYREDLLRRLSGPDGVPPRALDDAIRAMSRPVNEDAYPGLMPNVIAARVVQQLDLHGPNMTLDAGRDSTNSALATAVRYLRDGEMDLAVVIGVNATTDHVPTHGSKENAEAAVGFVLTRLSVARKHGMTVLGRLDLATDGTPAGTGDDEPVRERNHRGAEGAVALLHALHSGRRTVVRPREDAHTPALVVTPQGAAEGAAEEAEATTPVADAATPVTDAVTPRADAATPVAEATTSVADAVTPQAAGSLSGHLARHALVLRPVPARAVRPAVPALPAGSLVLTDDPSALRNAGIPADCLVVAPGTAAPDPTLPFPVTRLDAPGDLEALLAADGRPFGQIRVVVAGSRAGAAAWDVPERVLALHDLAFLAAKHAAAPLDDGGCLAVLALDAVDGTVPAPAVGLFGGLVRSLSQELPGCLVYALATDTEDARAGLARLAEESSAHHHIPVVHDTGGVRHELMLLPVEAPGDGDGTGLGLPEDPVIVATGGARGLTAHLVHELVADRAPRGVWLLGTGPAPDPAATALARLPRADALRQLMTAYPSETPAALSRRYDRAVQQRERAGTLQELERSVGAGRVHYRQCDVLDGDAVRTVIDEILAAEGRVDVLVHGAGLARSAGIARKKLADFRTVRDVKVRGYAHLRAALMDRSPALWCSVSSVSAFTGLRGEPDYGAANEFLLLAAAHARATEGADEVALASGLWVESGMASADTPGGAFLARQGEIGQMTDAQGREFFRAELRGRGSHGLATTWIGDADWTTLQRRAPGFRAACVREAAHTPERRSVPAPVGRRAFLTGPAHRDGTSATWEFEVGLDEHPYLLDHLVDGRPTVPGTFILEMAAEAAAELAPGLVPARVTDVVLSQFIRAARHRWPRTLRVSAVRDGDRVRVRITSPEAGPVPEREHSRMVVHLARTLPEGPLCPPAPPGGPDAPNTYELPGTPVELSGVFRALRHPRLAADGGSAELRLSLPPGEGVYSRFILPSVALDCLLRTSVLDGARPGDVPVIVPTALASLDLYTPANDEDLAAGWPEGLVLRHWSDASSGEEHCAVVAPDGRALVRVTGLRGAEKGAYDPGTRTWRSGPAVVHTPA
ncbi:SDR family NAD(P)-dependent oxidoreductase [Streptomyces sp. NPDC056549]|uniref:SDR family NAD(P)-dependent oxidoreductase n=1 Tax=Streptomyces sp. NPDC056549 TaxID=3345864 RepID=UPI0036815D93